MTGVLYASTSLGGKSGFELLNHATSRLLASVDTSSLPQVLWSLRYEQHAVPSVEPLPVSDDAKAHVLYLPSTPLDLAVDDAVFDSVRETWQAITGEDSEQFLMFKNREAEEEDIF